MIGVGNMLWGNDYPHHDAIWPNSLSVIDRILGGVSDEDVSRLTFDNVIELYGIRLPDEILEGVPA